MLPATISTFPSPFRSTATREGKLPTSIPLNGLFFSVCFVKEGFVAEPVFVKNKMSPSDVPIIKSMFPLFCQSKKTG